MKTIIILMLLISSFGFSQVCDYEIKENKTIPIDISLVPHMDTLISLFVENKIDTSKLLKIKGIYLKYYVTVYGFSDASTNIITINSNLSIFYPTQIKATLFHEIAHILLGELHSKTGPYLLQNGEYINPETIIKYWEFIENEYILYLKANL